MEVNLETTNQLKYIYIFTPTWWLILLKDSPNRENIEVGRWCLWNYSNYNHTMSRWLSKTSSSRFKQSATDVPAKARNEDAIGEAFLAAKNNILPSLPCFSSSCVFFNENIGNKCCQGNRFQDKWRRTKHMKWKHGVNMLLYPPLLFLFMCFQRGENSDTVDSGNPSTHFKFHSTWLHGWKDIERYGGMHGQTNSWAQKTNNWCNYTSSQLQSRKQS